MHPTLTLLCATAMCWAGAAMAQAPTPPSSATPSPGEVKALREFKLLDFNGDGQLSRSEVQLFPRLAAAFDDADTDHNGFVSFEEVQVFALKYRAERERKRAAEAQSQSAAASAPIAPASRPLPETHPSPDPKPTGASQPR